MVEIMPYTVPNFWTERNSAAKLRQLVKKGLPDLKGGRFVTTTINHNALGWDEETCYLQGLDRIRRMVSELRHKYGYKIRRYFWKLELHKPDGHGCQFPHWHFWFDYGGHIKGEHLTEAWGLGRTDIKKVRSNDWRYLFKYMCKSVDDLPEWLAKQTKPRCFQTSMGFFASDDKATTEEASPRPDQDDEQQNERIHEMDTIGERIIRWTTCVVARTTNRDGTYTHKLLRLKAENWGSLLVKFAQLRFSLGVSAEQIKISIQKVTTSWEHQLIPSLRASMS